MYKSCHCELSEPKPVIRTVYYLLKMIDRLSDMTDSSEVHHIILSKSNIQYCNIKEPQWLPCTDSFVFLNTQDGNTALFAYRFRNNQTCVQDIWM